MDRRAGDWATMTTPRTSERATAWPVVIPCMNGNIPRARNTAAARSTVVPHTATRVTHAMVRRSGRIARSSSSVPAVSAMSATATPEKICRLSTARAETSPSAAGPTAMPVAM